jgi:hypothetical protein
MALASGAHFPETAKGDNLVFSLPTLKSDARCYLLAGKSSHPSRSK